MYRRSGKSLALSTGKVFNGMAAIKDTPTEAPPFPLASDSGTFVPIYSTSRGRILKRHWTYHGPTWCSVCNEPIASWVTHIGRKDHSLLDTHYDLIVDFPTRRWDPSRLLLDVFTHDQLGSVGLGAFHAALDMDEKQRRTDIANMIAYLTHEGVLEFSPNALQRRTRSHWFGAHLSAHLVIHQFMIGPLMRILPACDLPVLSNFEDFISSSYNLETVYDLCSLRAVDPDAEQHSADVSPAWDGADAATAATTADGTTLSPEIGFSHKANFVKSVLGQLRWCVLHPSPLDRPNWEPYLEVVGAVCVRALIAEMTTARITEYMVRSEQIWLAHGLERRALTGRAEVDDPGLHTSRWDCTPQPTIHTYKSERLSSSDAQYVVPHEGVVPNPP